MLYELNDKFDQLQAVAFLDFGQHGKLEEDLEHLLAKHLLDTLYEDTPHLPFFQERKRQAECDIYALNEAGDVVLFELKRSTVSGGALDQLFRYTQEAGHWGYPEIAEKFRRNSADDFGGVELRLAHQEACGLAAPLRDDQFNRRQHMVLVGSAADTALIRAVDFWKGKGLSIEFVPYRVYEIGGKRYFEFFSKPHDIHTNPGSLKGVLFDTCRTHIPDAAKYMIERRRVSAFGDGQGAVNVFRKGDHVFYSHKGVGLIAAAKVVGRSPQRDKKDGLDELYWDVEFLTDVPRQCESFPQAMSFQRVRQVTGRNFWWAKTVKTPYLRREESDHLLGELQKVLSAK